VLATLLVRPTHRPQFALDRDEAAFGQVGLHRVGVGQVVDAALMPVHDIFAAGGAALLVGGNVAVADSAEGEAEVLAALRGAAPLCIAAEPAAEDDDVAGDTQHLLLHFWLIVHAACSLLWFGLIDLTPPTGAGRQGSFLPCPCTSIWLAHRRSRLTLRVGQ